LLSDEILLAVREWGGREWEGNGDKTRLNLGSEMGITIGNGRNGIEKDIPTHLQLILM